MSDRTWLVGVLVLLGAGWGATQPLAKVAVSTGHQPLGLIFWQMLIGAVLLGVIMAFRRRGLPMHREALVVYLIIALIGTVLPNSASYAAAVHLPSGILSIVLALVPMFAFPIALVLGIDRFSRARLAGLTLGLVGVALIAAPEASLPDRAMLAFLPIALIAPLFYAFEGNYVAKWGTAGCDPIEVLLGASIIGACLSLPLALASGQWVSPLKGLGAAEQALVASSVIHALVYATYVWMIGRAGSVFAAQVSYLVTGFGVIWAMIFLGERYSGWVWLAMAAMMCGLALVQPRPRETIAVAPKDASNGV